MSVKNNKKVKYQKFFYLSEMQLNSNPFLAWPFLIVAGIPLVPLGQAFQERILPDKSYWIHKSWKSISRLCKQKWLPIRWSWLCWTFWDDSWLFFGSGPHSSCAHSSRNLPKSRLGSEQTVMACKSLKNRYCTGWFHSTCKNSVPGRLTQRDSSIGRDSSCNFWHYTHSCVARHRTYTISFRPME